MKEQEDYQTKKLISLGKRQGYLVYSDIYDNLPHITDNEQLDAIITMLEGLHIRVFQDTPSEDQLAMMGIEQIPEDEDIDESEAAAQLSSVDKEGYRTSDPVRMYMREMGLVDLLSRQDEVDIAKRIEEGSGMVVKCLARYPEAAALILEAYDKYKSGEIRLNEIISGFSDGELEEVPPSNIGSMLNEEQQEEILEAVPEDEELGEEEAVISEVDEGPNPEQAAVYFDELREQFHAAMDSLRKHGRSSEQTVLLLDAMSASFLKLKLTSRQIDKLTHHFRQLRDHIREFERSIMQICIDKAHIERKLFIETFPGQETDIQWLDNLIAKHGKKLDISRLEENMQEIKALQTKLATFELE
jgi:RNA polymerase primary sigma factor